MTNSNNYFSSNNNNYYLSTIERAWTTARTTFFPFKNNNKPIVQNESDLKNCTNIAISPPMTAVVAAVKFQTAYNLLNNNLGLPPISVIAKSDPLKDNNSGIRIDAESPGVLQTQSQLKLLHKSKSKTSLSLHLPFDDNDNDDGEDSTKGQSRKYSKFLDKLYWYLSGGDQTLFECLRPVLIFGRVICAFSFHVERVKSEDSVLVQKIESNNDKDHDEEGTGGKICGASDQTQTQKSRGVTFSPSGIFIFRSSRWKRILAILTKAILGLYLLVLVVRERDKLKTIKLMDTIWKITFSFFALFVITTQWTLEYYRERWLEVFDLSRELHAKFRNLNIPIKLYGFSLALTVLCMFHFILGVPHILVVRAQNKRITTLWPAQDNSSYTDFATALNATTQTSTNVLSFIMDFMCWSVWHFADSLRISLAVYFWLLFFNLNRGLHSRNFTSSQLFEVMNLHLRISHLLRRTNSIISPITFVGCTFFVFYSCFYVNYLLYGFGSISRQILFLHFLWKNLVIFLVSADVSSRAHEVSEWLEKICSTEDTLSLDSGNTGNSNKLIIFTAQVYSRDSIGFKGLNFFTISTSFITALLSLILTYTVVITQFSGMFSTTDTEGSSKG